MITIAQIIKDGVSVYLDADGIYGLYFCDGTQIKVDLDFRIIKGMHICFPIFVHNNKKYQEKVQVQKIYQKLKLDMNTAYHIGMSDSKTAAEKVLQKIKEKFA